MDLASLCTSVSAAVSAACGVAGFLAGVAVGRREPRGRVADQSNRTPATQPLHAESRTIRQRFPELAADEAQALKAVAIGQVRLDDASAKAHGALLRLGAIVRTPAGPRVDWQRVRRLCEERQGEGSRE